MPSLAAWLTALVGPLAKKVLAALGLGVVSYTVITSLLNQAISAAQAAFGQVSGITLSILTLAGAPDVLGILSGALVARVSLMTLEKIGRVTQ